MKHSTSLGFRFSYILIAVFIGLASLSYSIADAASSNSTILNDSCFANHAGTVFMSSDASALQAAVDAASPNDLVRVSGDCHGVQTRFGITQTVYLSQSITLQGGWNATFDNLDPATQATTVDAGDGGRVVTVGPMLTVNISNLTLQNGSARDLGGNVSNIDAGGGILVMTDTVAHLDRVKINSNFADAGSGLYANRSTVKLSNSQMQNNLGVYTFRSTQAESTITATEIVSNTAGGIFVLGGTLDLISSEVASNTAFFAAGMRLADTVANVSNTTIANNKSGGGIAAGIHLTTQSVMTMSNSTISNNTGASQGAALHLLGRLTQANLIHVTVADNDGMFASVFLGADTDITLSNSIIDAGAGMACDTELITQTIALVGANLASDASCGASIVDDPLLADLEDNGGVTLLSGQAPRTHALPSNSPAQDMASNTACSSMPVMREDQRGTARAAACDLGAYDQSDGVPTTIQLGAQNTAHAPIVQQAIINVLMLTLVVLTLYWLPRRNR